MSLLFLTCDKILLNHNKATWKYSRKCPLFCWSKYHLSQRTKLYFSKSYSLKKVAFDILLLSPKRAYWRNTELIYTKLSFYGETKHCFFLSGLTVLIELFGEKLGIFEREFTSMFQDTFFPVFPAPLIFLFWFYKIIIKYMITLCCCRSAILL